MICSDLSWPLHADHTPHRGKALRRGLLSVADRVQPNADDVPGWPSLL